tara:strand:- start:48444 stop:48641 length:198 start_codon:yes stop_codon:yes gene_type:complete
MQTTSSISPIADFGPLGSSSYKTHLTEIAPDVQPEGRGLDGVNRKSSKFSTPPVALIFSVSNDGN